MRRRAIEAAGLLALAAALQASAANSTPRPSAGNSTPRPSAADMKCGAPTPEPLPLIAIDGETFRRGGSGLPVISVWTKDGPAGRMEPALARVRAAQAAHHERHGEYLCHLSDIDLPQLPPQVRLELTATPDRWAATARTERFLGTCRAGDGVEPYCEDDG